MHTSGRGEGRSIQGICIPANNGGREGRGVNSIQGICIPETEGSIQPSGVGE